MSVPTRIAPARMSGPDRTARIEGPRFRAAGEGRSGFGTLPINRRFPTQAVPLLLDGGVGAVGRTAALAVASTVVDVSPFSTNGAIVLANAGNVDRDASLRRLLTSGPVVVAAAPPVLWPALTVPRVG
jgi:hypothetical protein